MNYRLIIGALVLAIFAAALWWYYQPDLLSLLPWNRGPQYATEDTTIQTDDSGNITPDQQEDIAALAEEFARHYQQALSEQDEDAAKQARELLSWRGTTVIDRDPTAVAGLSRFTRGLEAPENIEITSARKVTDDFAEATAVWVYPNRRLERYFYIIIEDGAWKIDSIQLVPQ